MEPGNLYQVHENGSWKLKGKAWSSEGPDVAAGWKGRGHWAQYMNRAYMQKLNFHKGFLKKIYFKKYC